MRNFLMLIKINIRSNFFSDKSSIAPRNRAGYFLWGSVYLLLLASCGSLAYLMGSQLAGEDLAQMLIFMAVIGSAILCLLNALISGFGYLFRTKDYEMLSSLPIKTGTVFTSKLFSLLLMQMLYVSVIYIPFTVIYFIFAPFSIVALIYAFLAFFFLTMFPVSIGILLGMLINLIASRFKFKNLVTIILFIALIGGVVFLNANTVSIVNAITHNSTSIYNVAGAVYYPLILITEAILTGSFWLFLAFCGINLIPLFFLTIFISVFYKDLNSFFIKTVKVKKTETITFSKNKPLFTLIKKELKRLFASPLYFMNSCVGPILLLVLACVSMFSGNMLGLIETVGSSALSIVTIISFLTLLSSPLCISISLEGESFWIYKSLPVPASLLFSAKLLMQLIIFVPSVLLAALIIGISFSVPIASIIMLLFLSLAICLLSASMGMLIGTKKYNLHYTNEMQVIKQSSSVLITMLLGIVIAAAMIATFSFNFLPEIWLMLIWAIALFALSAFFLIKIYQINHEKLNEIV